MAAVMYHKLETNQFQNLKIYNYYDKKDAEKKKIKIAGFNPSIQGMHFHGCSGCTNPQIFGTSPFAPDDFEAQSSVLKQIQIPNACPG